MKRELIELATSISDAAVEIGLRVEGMPSDGSLRAQAILHLRESLACLERCRQALAESAQPAGAPAGGYRA